jgi:uncharacterized membrane protein YgcG
MKRAALSLVAGAVFLLSLLGLAAPAHAGVDDFEFESFTADYYLDVDADGRSTLTTVETFVAIFPDFDQNHGMRRAIPGDYLGAPTDVAIQSVTDENGNPRPFEVETDDDGFVLVTSREDPFVHGRQTYVFTYTQNNVTRYFANTNDDEFYWDTNGTGWAQYFGSVTARVHVPAELAASLTGQNACYRGYEGSTDTCELTAEDAGDETVISTTVTDVGPYENVSVAIGFEPHTFVPRDDSYFGSPYAIPQLLGLLASLIALIWSIALRVTKLADGKGRPTIIAEYTPPKNLDLVTASVILGKTKRAAAAQFVDFAVRRRIRIVETEKQGWFASGTTYLLELNDASGLSGPELNLAQALFGYQLLPGTGYLMSGKDVTLSQHVRAIISSATTAASRDGLRKRGTAKHVVLPVLLALLGAVASFVFGVIMLDNASGGGLPFLLFVPPIVVVLVVFGLLFRTPLSDKGAELRDHLKGLELYIRLAEADRLRMLQSPEGALKESISTTDPRQIVDIYEKLLPYAVLFSLEKEWAEELGKYYTEQSPDWYSGSHAFNAAVFASSINTLSTTAASSYSGSSSSSSSGGSGGGGSSGGGGGGGGGGGV